MAKDQTRRLTPKVVQDDTDAFTGLKSIKGYKPANANYAAEKGNAFYDKLPKLHETEKNAKNAYDLAHDASMKAEWDFHNFMLGAKDQVVAQFGDDSNEIQNLGMKKKSDYKRPKHKPNPTPKPTA